MPLKFDWVGGVVVQFISLSLPTLVEVELGCDILLSDLEKAKEVTPSNSDNVLSELVFGSMF